MTMLVFVGPTLRPDEVTSAAAGAVCLPPVAQGDVYRAARQGPSAIGIIDGYFSGAPSVWHKEILWALAEGIPVFGSASMGALRAAELHDFGMRGVGRIFEAYRDGALEDDDEVAVVHGPAETGFMVASEPMVNIRATLARAEADGVISPATRSRLEEAGKALFFPHRTWPAVVHAVGGDDVDLADFEKWLPGGAVDQKREDALEMLAAMHDAAPAGLAPSADFRFERTHFWDDLVERAANTGPQAGWATELPQRTVEELRLLGPGVYAAAERNALLRLLAEREARRRGSSPPMEATRAAATELRRTLGLFSRSQLEAWIGANDLDESSFERLVETEAHRHAIAGTDRRLLEQYLLDELRLSDQYRQLAERARDKAEKLGSRLEGSARGLPNTAQLRTWYFEQCLGGAIPEDVGSFAKSLGFSTPAELDRALLQEFVYTRLARSGLGSFDVKEADGEPLL
jgi:hypothetical protein